MIDSTVVRAHHSVAGIKKGAQQTEPLGRSHGGFTTKLHARCDAKGRPLGFVLTPGQAQDVQGFGPLFRMIAGRVHAPLADRGDDTDAIRAGIAIAGTQAAIPAQKGRRTPALHDRRKYRRRNPIERLFYSLKNWRRVATRCGKSKGSCLGFVSLAPALLW
ncbi:MAG: IS5 family transposase [Sphingopyxis sp.]|uniref:IS5 family transposase n=1 Tax=Sphingopyxis sp. TaxID=1908224 RepID=UPI002AB998A2|nr:IS5 family transposase [Sphingopyxis sp.]MDZ3832462.1 IS5 family transposase [Sphingopyxis sp.]